MNDFQIQLTSDIHRDGLGFELINTLGVVVAEVFRSDRVRTVMVTSFNNDIPLTVFEWFLREARLRLGQFEDGTPLG